MFARSFIIRTSELSFVKSLVTRSFLFRPLVKRFIAGEELDEALSVAKDLVAEGTLVSLDLLGENVDNLADAQAARDAYIEMLRRIGMGGFGEGDRINISIKLTQLGLDLGEEVAEGHYREVLEVAKGQGVFVRVDMESSEYTERTVAMIERVIADYPETGTVLQSMLHRTMDDAQRLSGLPSRIRLVKGAYLEPAKVARQKKTDVDQAYLEQAKYLLKHGKYPAFATHDPNLVEQIKAFAHAEGIDKQTFEWQVLYGISREMVDQLKNEGYRMRVYIPFGGSWYPYFTRRLAERPANSLFILKSLFRR